jgi:putative redox protein
MVTTFKATGHWDGCLRIKSIVRDFSLAYDEPPSLGGEDTAPNPVEAILSSLVGCLGIVACVVTNEKKIPFEGIDISVEGDLDPRGFMGQDKNVRPGMQSIRYNIKVKGNLSDTQLKEFLEEIEKRCPVSDTLKNGTSVTGRIGKV